jgi:hypothetical protein
MPVTTPPELTVATDGLLLEKVMPPEAVESTKVIVAPTHTVDGPLRVPADGVAITVTE